MNILGGFVWRLVRTAASVGISFGIAAVSGIPGLVWLAPVISAVAKVLREKFGLKDFPL